MMVNYQHRVNINESHHAHELTFCCYNRYPFLKAERTCQWLADAIDLARKSLDFSLWAYVFMPEHVHLLIYPRRRAYDVSAIRREIKAPVAQKAIAYLEQHAPHWIPKITRQRGKKTERLFWLSGGGYDRNCVQGKSLIQMIEYIHMNPVRRGLVARTRDWKWSSAAWFVDMSPIPLAIDPIPPEWLEDI